MKHVIKKNLRTNKGSFPRINEINAYTIKIAIKNIEYLSDINLVTMAFEFKRIKIKELKFINHDNEENGNCLDNKNIKIKYIIFFIKYLSITKEDRNFENILTSNVIKINLIIIQI